MTISQIAKMAGVSNSAVSRYLNNGYLSPEKRQAIARVIEQTGYRPSLQAQTLRTRKTRTVGVIVPKIDSYSISNVVAGITGVLERAGYQILLGDSFNDPHKELDLLALFDDQRVDGVILVATVFTKKHKEMLKRSKVPVVIAGQQLSGCTCVYHDDYNAFCDITRLVLKKDCRRLGYIGALPEDIAVGATRCRAYQDTVTAAGLPELAKNTTVARFTIGSGAEKARELWQTCGPLDAIICATGRIAIGAAQFLKAEGIAVPEQVLLTGQGDGTLCRIHTPAITTLEYYYEESGATAADLLLEKLADPKAALPPKEIKLGYRLVEQRSTCR